MLATVPSIRAAIRDRGMLRPDVLVIDHPRWDGLEKIVQPRTMIYRPTDLYTAHEQGLRPHETNLATSADGWIVTSRLLADHLRQLAPHAGNKPVLVLENGVDLSLFSAPAQMASELDQIPPPRAVFVGALDDRFDFATIRAAAAKQCRWSFVLIGPGPRPAMPNNVHYTGAVPHARLPSFLQHCDVGLLPTNDNALNAARSPMKLYEYAASGLPVVARETRELVNRKEPFVFFYQRSKDLATLLAEATSWSSRYPDVARNCAKRRDWPELTQELLSFVRTVTQATT